MGSHRGAIEYLDGGGEDDGGHRVVRVDVRAVLLGDVDDCLDLELLRERALDLRPIHIDGEGDLGPLLAVAVIGHVGEMGPLLFSHAYSVWLWVAKG